VIDVLVRMGARRGIPDTRWDMKDADIATHHSEKPSLICLINRNMP